MKLFKLDSTYNLQITEKDYWINSIKPFRKIFTRDKSKGKTRAKQEFMFLFCYCDPQSKYAEYQKDLRLQESLKNTGLTSEVLKDKVILEGIEFYENYIVEASPSYRVLNSLIDTLHTSVSVVNSVRQALSNQLDNITEFSTTVSVTFSNGQTKEVDLVSHLNLSLKSLLEMANKVPDTIKKIEEVKEKVKKEQSEDVKLRGDAVRGFKEDPTRVQVDTSKLMSISESEAA